MSRDGICWESVEYGSFDLSDFRSHAAALVRYLIRARAKIEPHFLNDEDLHRWSLANLAEDSQSVGALLKMGLVCVRMVQADMLAMGGSGGIRTDDPLGDFKAMIATFADESSIQRAVAQADDGRSIEWDRVAEWVDLPRIRDGLDELPERPGAPIRPPLDLASPPVAQSRRVSLFPKGHRPAAIVDNQPIERLTNAQHDVLRVLLDAGENGLSIRELVASSKHGDAVGVLKRLALSDEIWKHVIQLPGSPGQGYRVH